MFENECKSNVPIANDLQTLSHEEADTLLILYGIDVARTDSFQMLVVCSPDIDVLLLFIFFNKSLCRQTIYLSSSAGKRL